MIRSIFCFLFFFVVVSCVSNNHRVTIEVDCKNDTTIVTATDCVVVVREVLHDTIYIRERVTSTGVKRSRVKKREIDAFSEPLPKFE